MQLKCGLTDESYKCKYGIDDIGLDTREFERSTISLVAAKQDWAAFQLLLKGDEEFTVSTGASPFFSPRGQLTNVRISVVIDQLPETVVKIHPIGFVEDDDHLFKADILLHDEVVHVEPERTQPVWIEVSVPEETNPGDYNGSIHIYAHPMFEDEERICTLNFKLAVKDVSLPDLQDYKFHLDLWQHLSNIARKHEVPLWSDEHFKVIEEYVESLANLGQKAITVIVSEIPWSGQRSYKVKNYLSDLFEYSMIKVDKGNDGKFRYDFSVMERYINLCFQHGIDREIEVIGLTNIWVSPGEGYGNLAEDYPDAIRIRYFDHADNCFKYMRSANEIKQYIKVLEEYFNEKDWTDKVLIAADEPGNVELHKKRLDILSEVAPSFRYKTAINQAEFISEFKDRTRDFVPSLRCTCEEWSLLEKLRRDIKGRLLWYVCCNPPHPNTFICSPLLESRLIGILTAYMKFDGFLRWNYTVWPEQPRERISYRYPGWAAGDTNFVYPAADGRPLLTLRYKNLKRGIEDFELIQILKDLHPKPEQVLRKVWDKLLRIKDITDLHPAKGLKAEKLYSLNHDDYKEAKTMLLEAIAECGEASI